MAVCDMCGKDASLFKTEIEGGILNVCKTCAKYGKVLRQIKPPATEKEKKKIIKEKAQEPEIEQFVVVNCGEIIRKKREKLGKTQKEFAKLLNEKESIIQKIETGSFTPSIKTAKRFEKILNVKLVEEIEITGEPTQQKKTEALTIGDLIKIKK